MAQRKSSVIEWNMLNKRKYVPLNMASLFTIRTLLYPLTVVKTKIQVNWNEQAKLQVNWPFKIRFKKVQQFTMECLMHFERLLQQKDCLGSIRVSGFHLFKLYRDWSTFPHTNRLGYFFTPMILERITLELL